MGRGNQRLLRRPAAGAFPRLFADGDELARTLATTTLAQQLARIAGSPLGGLLLGIASLALASGLDALSFVAVLGVLLVVRPPHEPPPAAGGTSLPRQLVESLAAARRTAGVPATVLAVAGLASTVLPLVMLCVPLVGHERGWDASGTGAVSAAWVVGGLVVTSGVRRWGAPSAPLAVVGPGAAAAGAVLLAATSSPLWAVVALGVVGAGTTLLTARLVPRLLSATAPHLLARFSALLGLAQTGPVLVMTPLLGRLAGEAGTGPALVAVAAVLLLTTWAARRAEAGLVVPERTLVGQR